MVLKHAPRTLWPAIKEAKRLRRLTRKFDVLDHRIEANRAFEAKKYRWTSYNATGVGFVH